MLFEDMCICDLVEKITLNTKVTLMLHIKELKRITNTGKLINLTLDNKSIIVNGKKDEVLASDNIVNPDYENLILFPTAGNTLNKEFMSTLNKPINLIVPDGTWRQASKMVRNNRELMKYKQVKLPSNIMESSERERLRKNITLDRVSTFEAIASALGIIEGKNIKEKMEALYFEMVKRLLERRRK